MAKIVVVQKNSLAMSDVKDVKPIEKRLAKDHSTMHRIYHVSWRGRGWELLQRRLKHLFLYAVHKAALLLPDLLFAGGQMFYDKASVAILEQQEREVKRQQHTCSENDQDRVTDTGEYGFTLASVNLGLKV